MHEFKSSTVRGPDESQEHWEYRIFAYNFYTRKNPLTGLRFWLDQWGPRPPDNEADYREPVDDQSFQLAVHKGHREKVPKKVVEPRMPYAD